MTTAEEIPLQLYATSEQRTATILLHYTGYCSGDVLSFVLQAERNSVDQEGSELVIFIGCCVDVGR
jgi:hypothetical protein